MRRKEDQNIEEYILAPRSAKSLFKGLIIRIIVIAAVVVALFTCFVKVHKQNGSAMSPSVKDEDVVIVLKMFKDITSQTVCLYKTPDGETKLGRIIGIPNDSIQFNDNGMLMVNNIESSEGYILDADSQKAKALAEKAEPFTVPENSYYILNDRRSESGDSRTYGLIDRSDIIGQAFWQFRCGDL